MLDIPVRTTRYSSEEQQGQCDKKADGKKMAKIEKGRFLFLRRY